MPEIIKPNFNINGLEMIKRSFIVNDMVASADKKGHIEGHAAIFEQWTNIGGFYEEKFARSAFDKTDFSDVILTHNHRVDDIALARSRSNNAKNTMGLSIDDKGLLVAADLDVDNNSQSRALESAIKRGDISGMSLIMYVRGSQWDDLDKDLPKRTITDVAIIIEVSAVNWPAYKGTDVSTRGIDNSDIARKELEEARAAAKCPKKELELEKAKFEFNYNYKN